MRKHSHFLAVLLTLVIPDTEVCTLCLLLLIVVVVVVVVFNPVVVPLLT